jgi:uncharacterized NAD(P)/FAD-binding protein YdhS
MDMNMPPARQRRRIVIVGGGFSGAVVALNLLHKLPPDAASVSIVEPRAVLGAGLAYSAPDPTHRVNVSARRLLVLPGEPGVFDAWLRGSGILDEDPAALLPDGRAFPQRAVFGRYIDGVLRAKAAEPDVAPFAHLQARAVRITLNQDDYEIVLDNDEAIAADLVVLAVSHPPPAVPRPVQEVAGDKKFIADPWGKDALAGIGKTDRVLIIGTALSTADAVATLDAAGHEGEIVAVSRRGLVSRLRPRVPDVYFGDFATAPSTTALSLVRHARKTIAAAERAGSCWEAVIERIREQGAEIWAALPEPERRRFLRHVRPYWDVHRYQLAPPLAAVCAAKAASGQFHTRAARIISATADADGFLVVLRARGDTADTPERFDAIINCTGPDHTAVTVTNPALASLAAAGLLRPDGFGLGIETDMAARAIDARGRPVPTLFVSGPLARAAFGELMGLPQVSMHAALVAEQVSLQLSVVARQ